MQKSLYLLLLPIILSWQTPLQSASPSVSFPNCTASNAQTGNVSGCWNDVAGVYNNIVNVGNNHLWSNQAVTNYAVAFVNQLLEVSQAMCENPSTCKQAAICNAILPGFIALIDGSKGSNSYKNISGTSIVSEQWVSSDFTNNAVSTLRHLAPSEPYNNSGDRALNNYLPMIQGLCQPLCLQISNYLQDVSPNKYTDQFNLRTTYYKDPGVSEATEAWIYSNGGKSGLNDPTSPNFGYGVYWSCFGMPLQQ